MDRTKLRVQNKPLHIWPIDFDKMLRKIQLGRIFNKLFWGHFYIQMQYYEFKHFLHTVHKITKNGSLT